jgi:hypothetical protein
MLIYMRAIIGRSSTILANLVREIKLRRTLINEGNIVAFADIIKQYSSLSKSATDKLIVKTEIIMEVVSVQSESATIHTVEDEITNTTIETGNNANQDFISAESTADLKMNENWSEMNQYIFENSTERIVDLELNEISLDVLQDEHENNKRENAGLSTCLEVLKPEEHSIIDISSKSLSKELNVIDLVPTIALSSPKSIDEKTSTKETNIIDLSSSPQSNESNVVDLVSRITVPLPKSTVATKFIGYKKPVPKIHHFVEVLLKENKKQKLLDFILNHLGGNDSIVDIKILIFATLENVMILAQYLRDNIQLSLKKRFPVFNMPPNSPKSFRNNLLRSFEHGILILSSFDFSDVNQRAGKF